MKFKCIGCGFEYEGKEGDLCPRNTGNDKTCACLAEVIEHDKKKPRKIADQAEGDYHGSN